MSSSMDKQKLRSIIDAKKHKRQPKRTQKNVTTQEPNQNTQMTREAMHEARQKLIEQKKHGKKVVHDTESMIKELGYDLDVVVATEPKTITVRDQLFEAIAGGQVKTTSDVQQWMALHAPMTAMPGINHDLVAQMTAQATANAELAVARMLQKK